MERDKHSSILSTICYDFCVTAASTSPPVAVVLAVVRQSGNLDYILPSSATLCSGKEGNRNQATRTSSFLHSLTDYWKTSHALVISCENKVKLA